MRNFCFIARSAFSIRAAHQILMSFSCFCFSVTRIIDFCGWHLEGVTRLLDLGSLSLRFLVTRNWIGVIVVNEWEQSVQGSFSEHCFSVFYGKSGKVMTLFLQIRPGTAPLSNFSTNCIFLNFLRLVQGFFFLFPRVHFLV